jgi:hypothetical protein
MSAETDQSLKLMGMSWKLGVWFPGAEQFYLFVSALRLALGLFRPPMSRSAKLITRFQWITNLVTCTALLPRHFCGPTCISRWAHRGFYSARVTETWSGRADEQRHTYRSVIWLRGGHTVSEARRHHSWFFQESTTLSEVFRFISETLHDKLYTK